jgi:hypothetical protein
MKLKIYEEIFPFAVSATQITPASPQIIPIAVSGTMKYIIT